MNDYLALIGYACMDDVFRSDLLQYGAGAVARHPNLGTPSLTQEDRDHLDEFKNALNKPELTTAWSELADKIRNVCGNPPCFYVGLMGPPAP